MVVHKRKKVNKYRAHVTHGGGSRKKRRGAGSRGGRGNAGTGKRAGHKKAGISRKLGSRGFTQRGRKKVSIKTINVNYFTLKNVDKLVSSDQAVKEGETYSIDLNNLGYTKLLGTGSTNLKMKITISHFSARAEEKIKEAGGEILSANPTSEKSSEDKSSTEEKKAVAEVTA
jgi:large subunit ribosomal protein L15